MNLLSSQYDELTWFLDRSSLERPHPSTVNHLRGRPAREGPRWSSPAFAKERPQLHLVRDANEHATRM